MIVIGTDTHKASHTVAALDEATGRVLADHTVRAKRRSFADLLRWVRGIGGERVWALEDYRHVSGALERFLLALSEQRGEWQQRIQSVLYHHGCPPRGDLINPSGLAWLAAQPLSPPAREQVDVALAMIASLDAQLAPLDQQLRVLARRHTAGKALMRHYGIGPITAVTILAELGDARRFSSSRAAVRYAGLDITIHQSDQRRAPGHLSRQGPPALRWALFEAAQCARRRSSPDHAYYQQAAERLGGNRACLSIARKLLKRSYHTLRELGPEALAPA